MEGGNRVIAVSLSNLSGILSFFKDVSADGTIEAGLKERILQQLFRRRSLPRVLRQGRFEKVLKTHLRGEGNETINNVHKTEEEAQDQNMITCRVTETGAHLAHCASEL